MKEPDLIIYDYNLLISLKVYLYLAFSCRLSTQGFTRVALVFRPIYFLDLCAQRL